MKLSLVGIGARLRSEDGAAKIDEVIPGGPADQDKRDVRLRAGDKIIAVAQDQREPVNVLHWPLDKVVKLIRGEKGTRVVLTVIPATDPTGNTTKQVDLIRDEVKLEEQAAKGEVQSMVGADGKPRKFGIIRLPSFYANMQAESVFSSDYRSATDDVRKIIENLQTQGIGGVILDLRNNGGGSLVEAIRMTGLFISMGPVVQVRERFGVRVLQDRESDLVYDGPLMVLVSRMSASASEIVAGALQDYGRAIIVGDSKTHGKGSVQTVLDLGSDKKLGELRLTTASYYRISGGSTQLKGIAADIVLPSPFGAMDIGEEYQPYALEWSTVARVGYKPVADLTPVIDRLRARTLGRQQVDPRFTAYRQSLDRIQAINNSKELPLNIETRREWARTEKELAEIEEKLMDETKSDDGKGKPPDVVLAEALNMASDWAVWRAEQPEPPVVATAVPAEPVSWLRAIWDHIRFFFRSLVDYVQQCAR
jgi:carboxyl-terminal processing protease